MHTPPRNRLRIVATILVSTAGIALIAFLSIVGVQLYSNTQTEMYLLETEKKLDNIAQTDRSNRSPDRLTRDQHRGEGTGSGSPCDN